MLLYRTSLMNTNDDIVYEEDSQYEAKMGIQGNRRWKCFRFCLVIVLSPNKNRVLIISLFSGKLLHNLQEGKSDNRYCLSGEENTEKDKHRERFFMYFFFFFFCRIICFSMLASLVQFCILTFVQLFATFVQLYPNF